MTPVGECPPGCSRGAGGTIAEIARGFLKSSRTKRDVLLLSYFFQIVRGIPFTGGARGTAAPAQATRGRPPHPGTPATTGTVPFSPPGFSTRFVSGGNM